MTTQRITLDDLRAKIEAYRALADNRSTNPSSGVLARIRGYESDAWEAAYLWHLGVTHEMKLADEDRAAADWVILEAERKAGIALIQERLG